MMNSLDESNKTMVDGCRKAILEYLERPGIRGDSKDIELMVAVNGTRINVMRIPDYERRDIFISGDNTTTAKVFESLKNRLQSEYSGVKEPKKAAYSGTFTFKVV